ncbi:UNVERIFIED_CONTAM: hypothetical protein FKN15_015381 [Acipenser sinensis]
MALALTSPDVITCYMYVWQAPITDEHVLIVESCSGQYEDLPKAVLTQESEWIQIYESESVTLRCQVPGNYTEWRFTWYNAGANGPVTQDFYISTDGDSYTISSAAQYHSGVYACRGGRRGNPSYSTISNSLTLIVSELFSTPTLTVLPDASVWEGEAVMLQCGAHIYKQGTQLQYSYSNSGAASPNTIPAVVLSDEGSYQCEVEAAETGLKKRSDSVSLTVREGRPKPALSREGSREPAGEIFEGDTVTLSCVVEGGSGGWRYLWYKDRQGAPVYQTDSSSGTGAGYTISAAALSHSGEYWCGARRGRNTFYSQYSDPIWVNVTALFSRVTLTASPGVTVKEGEALNLTCEAAVNKTPRPQLHYTILKDREPVTSSTDSALYSIASTEKSHTGSYTCAVESQGVKKSSQELHIEVQKSWSWIIAALSVSLVLIVIHSPLLSSQSPGRGSLLFSVSLVLIVIHSPLLSPQSPGRGSLLLSVS